MNDAIAIFHFRGTGSCSASGSENQASIPVACCSPSDENASASRDNRRATPEPRKALRDFRPRSCECGERRPNRKVAER
jgi:hypothetical protein